MTALFRSLPLNFDGLVSVATGGARPYGYQSRLAAQGLPDVLRVPTGTGKTLAAVLPWLYRRCGHPDAEVRKTTPRWLIFVLPQRALVEQTVEVIKGWLGNLRLDVPVHVLMGGEDTGDRDWKAYPERERIFVGTLDMVLSRLLMRGFAEFRSVWPMSFGLLHAGVQFVFDEVQLMGPGLPTALQLQGMREAMGTAMPCRSMWMSATLQPTELSTVDSGGSCPSWSSTRKTAPARCVFASQRPDPCAGSSWARPTLVDTPRPSPRGWPRSIVAGRGLSWCSTPCSG
ncbi:MAG: DEAD/DEAH box helicase [Actinomycetota bacterium]|nr:DEAD/DEAH box helicase [Actinomycetota bacterium]